MVDQQEPDLRDVPAKGRELQAQPPPQQIGSTIIGCDNTMISGHRSSVRPHFQRRSDRPRAPGGHESGVGWSGSNPGGTEPSRRRPGG